MEKELQTSIRLFKQNIDERMKESEINRKSIENRLKQITSMLQIMENIEDEGIYVDSLCEMEYATSMAEAHTQQLLYRLQSMHDKVNEELDLMDTEGLGK